ncbi:MAG: hypothetical protein KAI24_24620 [Planctomycetes bacterium]|nr:hypothetical protein [Planctomycetota bacterium]
MKIADLYLFEGKALAAPSLYQGGVSISVMPLMEARDAQSPEEVGRIACEALALSRESLDLPMGRREELLAAFGVASWDDVDKHAHVFSLRLTHELRISAMVWRDGGLRRGALKVLAADASCVAIGACILSLGQS